MRKVLSILLILTILPLLSACHISSWLTYTNSAFGFELQYPGGGGGIAPGESDTNVQIRLPFTSGTNLVEKYLDISVTMDASTCESPYAAGYAEGSLTPTTVTMNGIAWVRENAGEGAMGNYYQWTSYSTVSGTVCVSLTFILHSVNPGVYTTPPPTYDQAGESSVFALIVNTFQWLSGAAITPEGASGWLTYTNSSFGFKLMYPPGGGGLQPGDTAVSARIDLPFAGGTNLTEKYLAIEVDVNPTTCGSPYGGGPTPVPTTLTIAGLTWVKQEAGEGAAGSIFLWTTYSTQSGIVCVSLGFVRHSHPPDLDPTPPPTYDEAAESEVFVQIVETFIWLSGAAVTPTAVYSPTPTLVSGPIFKPHMNAYCRSGPDPIFNSISLAMEGENYPIVGQNRENTYFLLRLAKSVECWVLASSGEASGDLSQVRVLLPISTPTFTPLPDQTFNCAQFTSYNACTAHKDLCTWRQLTDKTGICENNK